MSSFRVLLIAAAAVSSFGLVPVAQADISLAKVDAAFLQALLAARSEKPFAGGHFSVEENPQAQSVEAAKECSERRNFRLLRPLEVATPDGKTAWEEFEHYSIMICQHGPLAPAEFQSTIDSALQPFMPSGKRSSSTMQAFAKQIAGFSFRIGDRVGRTAVIMGAGHGVMLAPIAVIPSRDASATLCAVLDDPHLGDPGHEIERTLTDLVDLLKAVDQKTQGTALER
jgi:hypothetical protein